MASDGKEETLDKLDSATVQPVQSEQLKYISAECLAATSSSVLSLVEPAYIKSYNGGDGNEMNVNVDQVSNTYGSKTEFADDKKIPKRTKSICRTAEKGKPCKKSKFSFVLACSHTVCKACAELEFCECKQSIGEPHACILESRTKYNGTMKAKRMDRAIIS